MWYDYKPDGALYNLVTGQASIFIETLFGLKGGGKNTTSYMWDFLGLGLMHKTKKPSYYWELIPKIQLADG